MSENPRDLFTITEAHLDTGLRGFPVGTCRTSRVDPQEGVSYAGYPIADLVSLDPEDVVYLLLHKDLPTAEQATAFREDLSGRMGLPTSVIDALRSLPREGHPMEWLLAGLTLTGMVSKTGDWLEDAKNLVARMPELVAGIFRVRSGWGDPIPPDPSVGLVENFVHMLGLPGASDEDLARLTSVMRTFYILHMDHGGGNLSTFTGKAVASGHADIFASLTAAMAALYGPLHGRANQDCLEFVRTVGSDDPDKVEQFVRDALDRGDKIYGFGHAVLRAEDPRASIQYALGEELIPNDPLFRTAKALRERAVKVLKGIEKVSNPYPNVDAVSGTLLQAAGLEDSNYYTVLFGFARVSGIAAQVVDERTQARGGRGVPIYRPKFVAKDQTPRRRNG